jgi:peroxiredoxin/Tfp pilus assembly protein PilF
MEGWIFSIRGVIEKTSLAVAMTLKALINIVRKGLLSRMSTRSSLTLFFFSHIAVCLSVTFLFLVPSDGLCFRNVKEGDVAPDFSLQDVNGKTYSLSQFRGKVLVLTYWRAGQDRSTKALEALQLVYEKLANQPFQILAVTKDADRISEIRTLQQSLGFSYPILLDKEEKVYSEFGVFVFPSTALIDKQGIYHFHFGGYRDSFQDEIFGRARVLLGMITEEQLQAERERKLPIMTEDQKRAINHINLGKTLQKRGLEEKALREFEKSVDLDPNNAEGHVLLGFSLLYNKEVDNALPHFQKGVALDPRSTDAKIGLGSAYRLKGELDKALETLRAGLGLCPDSAVLHLELGNVYESLGNKSAALKHYKTSAECSLKMRPRNY